ncbi:hypothetical protein [uncultured Desulfobacter sp.]|nr:hypothetical protein [uncultured Desulfobacter sp.]
MRRIRIEMDLLIINITRPERELTSGGCDYRHTRAGVSLRDNLENL